MNHSLIEKTDASRKHLVIGLDFGAAFSKVVIGDKRVKYAVPFAEFLHSDNQAAANPYLLPSMLNIDDNNLCHLSSTENSNSLTQNLKFPLLDNSYTNEELLRLAAYLALVFRASTGWLLTRYKKRYSGSKICWSVNAGLSVAGDSNSELPAIYKQVLHTAWVISVLPGPITLNRLEQYMAANESVFDAFPALYRSRIINQDSIKIFTGCSAQICGYVHWKNCCDDLHMLIDVGAATINIATFMVDKKCEDKCKLYACVVEPIGVAYLLKKRYENLQLPENKINLFKDIPANDVFSQTHDLTEKDIKFADTLYSGEAVRLINKVMAITKNQYCSDASSWQSGVQTLTYGGGARLEIFQNIINRLAGKSPPHKITSIKLTPPDDFIAENLPEDSYDRLSVAYGLSFEAADIARVSKGELITDSEATTGV